MQTCADVLSAFSMVCVNLCTPVYGKLGWIKQQHRSVNYFRWRLKSKYVFSVAHLWITSAEVCPPIWNVLSAEFYGVSYKLHLLVRINSLVHFFSQLNLQSLWRLILPATTSVAYSDPAHCNACTLFADHRQNPEAHFLFFSVMPGMQHCILIFPWPWACLICRIATRGHNDPWTWSSSCVLHTPPTRQKRSFFLLGHVKL